MSFKIRQIPTDSIKFFVRRARRERAYSRLKQSIKEVGLKVPIGVRSMSDRPRKERRRPDGGVYGWELVYGQGRLQAFRELGTKQIPAVVIDVGEEEIVGRFLAENVMRRKLTWHEKAELIRYDVEENGLDVDEIADRYCITGAHVMKYLRLLTGASEKTLARAARDDYSLAETEKLTTLPLEAQDIVIDVIDEEGLNKASIKELVDRAAKINRNGRLTKETLADSLKQLNATLRKAREKYKLRKLEYALGPQHVFRLVEDAVLVANCEAAGIDLSHFKTH